jgi:hypothetical protein
MTHQRQKAQLRLMLARSSHDKLMNISTHPFEMLSEYVIDACKWPAFT